MTADEREDPRDDVDRLVAAIPAEVEPPPGLRGEVVARLGAVGLIRRPRSLWRGTLPWAAAAVAAVVAFAAGRAGIGVPPAPAGTGPAGGSTAVAGGAATHRYLFLLYEDDRFDAGGLGPDALVSVYADWVRRARAAGVLESAEKLADAGIAVGGGEAAVRTIDQESPLGSLTGFFIVTAPDRDAAIGLARETPHYGFGGTVLVRDIDAVSGGGAGPEPR